MTESATGSEIFNERAVVVDRPTRHYVLLEAEDGRFASFDGEVLSLSGAGDDSIVWDLHGDNEVVHVTTGFRMERVPCPANSGFRIAAKNSPAKVENGIASVRLQSVHGPSELPSAYLDRLRSEGWVCLPCILSPQTVEGLEWVACTDRYAQRERTRGTAIAQHIAVARTVAEPISLWLIRQYLRIPDVRLSHAPGIAVLHRDDGSRNVQGWHSDFPYHWGTGHKGQVPSPSGNTVLGVQRNVCVSDFTKERGATAFKLGSHKLDQPPPAEWGPARLHARPNYRSQHGLPYSGDEADVIEAPGGSIVLFDSRTWHRAGVNRTDRKRAAMLLAMTPMYVFPKNDTSRAYLSFRESDVFEQANEREKREIENLMVHQFIGPGGEFAVAPDRELTESLQPERAATSRY